MYGLLFKNEKKSGWLFERNRKQGHWSLWNRRWVVLAHGHISNFSKQATQTKKKCSDINLRQIKTIEDRPNYRGSIHKNIHRFRVSVRANSDVIDVEFAAESMEEKLSWINFIKCEVNTRKTDISSTINPTAILTDQERKCTGETPMPHGLRENYKLLVADENEISSKCACDCDSNMTFCKKDRIGSGVPKFKEFAQCLLDRQESVRTCKVFDAIRKIQNIDRRVITLDELLQCLLESNVTDRSTECLENKVFHALQNYLEEVWGPEEASNLTEYVRLRWKMFLKFRRKTNNGKVVMKCGHGLVEKRTPGTYRLFDIASFSDLPPLVPKHTVVNDITWESSTSPGKSGHLLFPSDFDGKIQTDIATNETLRFYGCCFADSEQTKISLLYDYWIQDFTYEDDYLSEYIMKTNMGSGLEKHEFSHLDCPLTEESGHFILAKFTESGALCLTALKVPIRHTLYIPGNCIHSNDYLLGTWRTMLSDQKDIDHVLLTKRKANGNCETFRFEFE